MKGEYGVFTEMRQIFFNRILKKVLALLNLFIDACASFSKFNINAREIKTMSRVCAVTGKRPVKGRRIVHKGQSKKSGGIGLQLVKQTKRTFRPNLQRIRVKLPNGSIKRLWVSVKALKAGLVEKV